MEFKIGKMVENNQPTNVYVVEVTMMHGDADAYTTQEVRIPKEREDLLEDLIETLNEMNRLPWNDARRGYKKLMGFKKWFGPEFLGPMDDEPGYDDEWDENVTIDIWDEIKDLSFDWERDITYDDIYARLDGYKMFYLSESGTKFHVEIEKD